MNGANYEGRANFDRNLPVSRIQCLDSANGSHPGSEIHIDESMGIVLLLTRIQYLDRRTAKFRPARDRAAYTERPTPFSPYTANTRRMI